MLPSRFREETKPGPGSYFLKPNFPSTRASWFRGQGSGRRGGEVWGRGPLRGRRDTHAAGHPLRGQRDTHSAHPARQPPGGARRRLPPRHRPPGGAARPSSEGEGR